MTKIAMIIHSLDGGGAERVASGMMRYWAAAGHDVALVMVAGGDRVAYPVDPRVKAIHLGIAGESTDLFTGVVANIRRIFAIRGVLRRFKPDVALGFMTSASVLLALSSVGMGHYTIGCERNYPPKLPLGGAWELLRKTTYGLLDAVVGQTSGAAAWIAKNTFARRVAVIPNPIPWPLADTDPFVNPDAFLSHHNRVVLGVGRLEPQKGFDTLIEAFAISDARRSGWRLVILGEGPLYSPLSELASRLGVANQVIMPGRVGNVSQWMQRAQIFCLSSLFEGFPNVLLEAMASGMACISTDCEQGPREIVHDGVNGLLVAVGSPPALASAIDGLILDQERRKAMRRAAKMVVQDYAEPKVMAMWEALFPNSTV